MPVAMGSHHGTRGGTNRCAASASDRTADDRTPHCAASCRALRHEDDNPAALSATASPNTVAAPMRSLFQTDAIGARITLHTAWAARSGAVAEVDTVTW